MNACADLVRRADPERFMAAMAAPVAARAVLFPLYAFNAEVARAPWVTQEPMIAEMRLQWWRDVLEEIRQGGPVRRHEVATPLAGILHAEDTGPLDDLITARRWDAYKEPFEDHADFQRYITQTAGHLMWVAARRLGAAETVRQTVLDTGYAQGLANYLRAIPALEKAGRIPLVDGRADALRHLAQDGLDRLVRARKARAQVAASARPALLPAWKAAALLRQVTVQPSRVAAGAVDISPMASRLTLMGRAATGRW